MEQQRHQLRGEGFVAVLHVLPGEQLEQIVAVICVRHGEGTVLQRKLGDIGLVGVKDDPIIAIGRLARAIVDASVGGEQSRVAGGIDALAVAVPKAKGRVGEYEQVIAVPPGHVVDEIGGMHGVIADHVNVVHVRTAFGKCFDYLPRL